MKKILCLLLVALITITGCHMESDSDSFRATNQNPEKTPFGTYDKTITYTLANLIGQNNSNMPHGDTPENNAYTRYLKKVLNIQNKDVLEATESDYFDKVSMMISSGKIPDVMIISDYDDLKYLVDNDMVADLTSSFNNCMSSRIKEIYKSYPSDIMDNVIFNNKIMAIPETNINDGPNLFWVRQDWLDKLKLKAPKTIDDVENIISEFKLKDPGNNGINQTVGLVVDTDLMGGTGYSSEYLLDIIFGAYNSYPKQWLKDKNNKIVYGSTTLETKEALSRISQMYKKGIIDKNFLLRTRKNIVDLIVSNKCGAFFGPWWAPNNPLIQAVTSNKTANWVPYLIGNEQGVTNYHSQNPSNRWVVVRKGYQHPEIVCKIISVIFDYLRYGQGSDKEIDSYYANNVDPTARPISINVDYIDALDKMNKNITAVQEKRKKYQSLPSLDRIYYDTCTTYLKDKKKASSEHWAAYASRILALSTLNKGKLNEVKSWYFGNTPTMISSWWELSQLEKDTFIQIIIGKKDLSYFDKFVKEWQEKGGIKISQEVTRKVEGNTSR